MNTMSGFSEGKIKLVEAALAKSLKNSSTLPACTSSTYMSTVDDLISPVMEKIYTTNKVYNNTLSYLSYLPST